MKTICKIATLLLLMLSLTCSVQAKDEMDITSTTPDGHTYLPFVQKGKVWRMVYYTPGDYGNYTIGKARYRFSYDEVVKDGKAYLPLYYEDDDLYSLTPMTEGLFREEDKKVYRYDEETQTETLLYDFSLKVGDIFTCQPDEWGSKKYKVIKEDTIVVNGHHLRELTIKNNSLIGYEAPFTVTECIGGRLRNPLEAFKSGYYTSYHVAYVQFADDTFLPFSITEGIDGWRGLQLVHDEEEKDDGEPEELNFELIGRNPYTGERWLHMQGNMYVQCGPNNYIYCRIQDTEKPFTLSLQVEEAEPIANCMGLYHVDLYFEVYLSDYEYVEFNGKRYPVVNHIGEYRPFIANNKVWKVGWFPDGENVAKRLANYYFDGDTIVGGQIAKRLMCEWQATPDYAFEDGSLTYTEYVAALYETGRRVYFVLPGQTEYKVLYDFGADVGSSFSLGDGTGIYTQVNDEYKKAKVLQKGYMDEYYFKGIYVDAGIGPWDENNKVYTWGNKEWYEGVGGTPTPLDNFPALLTTCESGHLDLLSCVVGDELIYQNPDPTKIDGVNPPDEDEAKRRIDFTHTIKTQPKAPRFNASQNTEESISGEYNQKLLTVELGQLIDTYDVTITSPSGNTVYQKEVQAGNVLALNIDISTLTDTDYTLTLENSNESFTGTFNPSILTDIESLTPDSIVNRKSANRPYYDLTGRPVSVPSQGMYIQDGKKVFVK